MTIQAKHPLVAESGAATGSRPDSRPVTLDLGSTEFLANPYPWYERLRETDPVHRAPWGDWYLTRFDDVSMVLSDDRFGWGPPDGGNPLTRAAGEVSAFGRVVRHWPVFMDPPGHTRHRALATGFFTRRRIDGLRSDIEEIAADLLDRVSGAGTMEIVADFAYPLPARLMARLLGMPENDCDLLKSAFLHLTHGVDRGEMGSDADAVMTELTDYFDGLAADKRRHPGDDLLSVLLAAEVRGELTAEEVAAAAILYMWTGHETTKNLIGNAVIALLRHPDQMAALIADPGLSARTVAEVLRYESPVQRAGRWTLTEVEIGGVDIPEGQYVSGIIGAAHRDPAQFADPDRFDIRRKPGPLLAFGRGAHYCLGHGLARLEGEIALTALLHRTGMLAPAAATVDAALAWQTSTSIRGAERLSVTFSPQG